MADEIEPTAIERLARSAKALQDAIDEMAGSLHYGVPVTREQAAQDRAEHDAEQQRLREQT